MCLLSEKSIPRSGNWNRCHINLCIILSRKQHTQQVAAIFHILEYGIPNLAPRFLWRQGCVSWRFVGTDLHRFTSRIMVVQSVVSAQQRDFGRESLLAQRRPKAAPRARSNVRIRSTSRRRHVARWRRPAHGERHGDPRADVPDPLVQPRNC